MNDMRLVAAYFSPTGTTAKITRSIVEGFACSAREIDLSASVSPMELQKDELLLVAIPVFSGRVPSVALDRLEQISDGTNKAIAVVVYGNRAFDDALLELKDALERKGFQVIAAAAFVAEHSMARSIAAGRPDAKDLAQAGSFGSPNLTVGVKTPISAYPFIPIHPYFTGEWRGSQDHHAISQLSF